MQPMFMGSTIKQIRPGRVKVAYGSASLILQRVGPELYVLEDLYSGIRRRGHATGAMTAACRWADANGFDLSLRARANGKPPGLSNRQLYNFYQRFGFEPTYPMNPNEHPIMKRKVQTSWIKKTF